MRTLLRDPDLARRVGEAGRAVALRRFGLDRFARDWDAVLREAVDRADRRGARGSVDRAPVEMSA
jgi:glycosyltransferase involved in cell wall biosynthesis